MRLKVDRVDSLNPLQAHQRSSVPPPVAPSTPLAATTSFGAGLQTDAGHSERQPIDSHGAGGEESRAGTNAPEARGYARGRIRLDLPGPRRLGRIARSLVPFWDEGAGTSHQEWILAMVAGISFGVGMWFKYPTVLAVPAALLLAGRRSIVFLAAMAVTALALFSPYLGSLSLLYQDTVVYQQSRFIYPLGIRILSVVLFAVLLQPLAVFGAFGRPIRWWLVVGYASCFLYIESSQVYYHYMLPVVPFASILGAMYLGRLRRFSVRTVVSAVATGAVGLALIWGVVMADTPGDYPFHITSAHTAAVTPVSRYIDALVPKTGQILDDQPDLPVLAYRQNCDYYFWSDSTVLTHSQLQFCLLSVRYLVHFFVNGSGFPPGFLLHAADGSGISPPAIDDKYHRTVVGSGSSGAFVYDTRWLTPYVPPRD